jgi:Flp pilus assembly protein TadD
MAPSLISRKSIELNPKSASTWYNRGIAKNDKRDWDGAIADYSKAIELNPKLASAYNNRGVAKRAKGDQAGADADFAQADIIGGH